LNNSSFYRGQTIWLNSTVTSSCSNSPPHSTYWYNESTLIGSGDDIQWQIPLDDSLLGLKNITAYANSSGYIDSSSSIFITILNNLPEIRKISTNVSEVQSGEGIEITCEAYDLEDCPSSANCNLVANISILDANGNWDNASANKIGNTFYRDYTAPYSPRGEYKAYCILLDTDNGKAENYTTFLVYQNASITINFDKDYYSWNETAKVFGYVKRKDGTAVANSPIDIFLEGKKVCNSNTDLYGSYSCSFVTPNEIGNYKILVNVTDILTNKMFANSSTLVVKFAYGASEKEEKIAKSVSCYEIPQLVINPDGTIKKVYVRVCVWE